MRELLESLREKFQQITQRFRGQKSEWSPTAPGVQTAGGAGAAGGAPRFSMAEGLRSAGQRFAPWAHQRLLRLPGLEETLQRFQKHTWIVWALAGVLVADLGMTGLGNYLATKNPPVSAPVTSARRVINLDPYVREMDQYNAVINANPFCPGCPIPDLAKLQRPKDCGAAKPLASSGVKLIGTIVLSDPQYSVATLSRGSESLALQKGDNLSGVGEVYEIRQGRVCFIVGNGSLQFVDLPSDLIEFDNAPAPTKTPRASYTPANTPGIDQVSETEFNISKDALNKKLDDPNLLSEALAVPHREDGELKGWKIMTIKPGSVYESLGVRVGDVVLGVNGEPLNSVAKAQELFVSLRTQEKVSITINRNGNEFTQTYSIR